MKLKDLPFSVFSSLCRLLDSTEPAGQNWRELLSHFPGTVYMPSDVAAFARESTRPDGSPAQAVLQDFIVRGLSVDHLFLMLCDMGHVEGMKTIQQYASPSLHHLLELRLSHTTSGSDRTPQPDPEGDRTSTLKQDTESEATAGPVEEESPSVTALHRLHSTIRESVTIKSLIPFLNEENLLTVDDLAILSLSSTTEFEKIDYLVSLLPHKGDFWDKFIRSLRHPDSLLETAHGEVADKLEEEKQKIEADRQRWPLWQQFEQSRQWQVQSGQVQSGTDVSHIVPRPQLVPSLPERAESQPPPSPLVKLLTVKHT